MNDLEYVRKVIDGMINDYKIRKQEDDYDALDESYFNCSINTLELLKYRLRLN